MLKYTYENVTPSFIANTTMQKRFMDGVAIAYTIKADDGYVLHDNTMDWTDIDPETGESVLNLGYAVGTKTCGADYDFAENSREFYAVAENSVPADRIFGGGRI